MEELLLGTVGGGFFGAIGSALSTSAAGGAVNETNSAAVGTATDYAKPKWNFDPY